MIGVMLCAVLAGEEPAAEAKIVSVKKPVGLILANGEWRGRWDEREIAIEYKPGAKALLVTDKKSDCLNCPVIVRFSKGVGAVFAAEPPAVRTRSREEMDREPFPWEKATAKAGLIGNYPVVEIEAFPNEETRLRKIDDNRFVAEKRTRVGSVSTIGKVEASRSRRHGFSVPRMEGAPALVIETDSGTVVLQRTPKKTPEEQLDEDIREAPKPVPPPAAVERPLHTGPILRRKVSHHPLADEVYYSCDPVFTSAGTPIYTLVWEDDAVGDAIAKAAETKGETKAEKLTGSLWKIYGRELKTDTGKKVYSQVDLTPRTFLVTRIERHGPGTERRESSKAAH